MSQDDGKRPVQKRCRCGNPVKCYGDSCEDCAVSAWLAIGLITMKSASVIRKGDRRFSVAQELPTSHL